jgi:ribosomal protein S18 acetylase RimI-like enzyme
MSDDGMPHHGYSVRRLRETEGAACVALWQRCGLIVAHNDPEADIARWRAHANAEILVVEREDALVASVCVAHDGHRGWLYYLAVEPDLQHRGLGRHLVREAEAWLAARDIPKVQLMIRPANGAAQGFYESIGYDLTPRLVLARWLNDSAAAPSRSAPAATEPAKLTTTITYLEMTARPQIDPVHPPSNLKIALLHAEQPPVAFYRFLYDTVGKPWLWWERRVVPDEALGEIVGDPRVEIYVLHVNGTPAGFAELDCRDPKEIELAYFGLMPDFIGRGLGPYLLYSVIEIAWDRGPQRLMVNTNTLDHPKALSLYQRMGFRPYNQEQRTIVDPRAIGIMRG